MIVDRWATSELELDLLEAISARPSGHSGPV